MGIFKIAAFALLAVSLVILIRVHRPEMALQVSIIAGLLILGYAVVQISGIIDSLNAFAQRYGIDTSYIGILLKIIGIAYVAQFACEICKDAGESALASKVELGGRVLILAAALPAAISLLDMVATLLPVSAQ